ncbi:MAG: class I SAM-dependent methyltransferase [Pseudomonadota bacterium]
MSRAMPRSLAVEERIQLGLRAANRHMYQQDKIWSRYSNDKVDIAGTLARVLRTLNKSLPLDEPLKALSIGSSNEPQFRILESAFRGGFYLLDIESAALEVIKERIERQNIHHLHTIHDDYCKALCDTESVLRFRKEYLDNQCMTLITLHHSLYYSPMSFWDNFLSDIYEHLLVNDSVSDVSGAVHVVLMASRSDEPTSTTWLYNHFAGKFFDHSNDQDLNVCAEKLRATPRFDDAQVLTKSSRVDFFVEDFELFMSVVWMILLHPNVHTFSEAQQKEVTEYIYEKLWSRGLPLIQFQDHLVIYRGKGISGLI